MKQSKRNFLWLMAVLGLMTGVADSAKATLIINGGFENPVTPTGGAFLYQGGSSFAGWNVTGTDIFLANTFAAESRTQFNSHSGLNAIDITGNGNTGPEDGVFQLINTTVGQNYLVSFYVGRADDSSPGNSGVIYATPSSVGLTITGMGPTNLFSGTFTNSNKTENFVNWQLFTASFQADSTSTRIAFTNATAALPGGNNYAGLDDVSVVATPEPSTIALAVSAVPVGVIAFLRRRKPTKKLDSGSV